ncbi:MAG: hypothetical protein MHPSP_004023, partial [Paramarteilia canceri]
GNGYKILLKMGYVPGLSLGKNNTGLLHPIKPKILPKQTSLDFALRKDIKYSLETTKTIKKFTNKKSGNIPLGELSDKQLKDYIIKLENKIEIIERDLLRVSHKNRLKAEMTNTLNIDLKCEIELKEKKKRLAQERLKA